MSHEGNRYFRDKDTQRQSILQELACPDASYNEFKMRLPSRLEVISQQNNAFSFFRGQAQGGYDLLPLYHHEWSNFLKQKNYCLGMNDYLADKWSKFQQDYPASINKPVMPEAKDVRFVDQRVVCDDCKDSSCGMRMVSGPHTDEAGPLPIPANMLNCFRDKLKSAKQLCSKKPFK